MLLIRSLHSTAVICLWLQLLVLWWRLGSKPPLHLHKFGRAWCCHKCWSQEQHFPLEAVRCLDTVYRLHITLGIAMHCHKNATQHSLSWLISTWWSKPVHHLWWIIIEKNSNQIKCRLTSFQRRPVTWPWTLYCCCGWLA